MPSQSWEIGGLISLATRAGESPILHKKGYHFTGRSGKHAETGRKLRMALPSLTGYSGTLSLYASEGGVVAEFQPVHGHL